MRQGDGRSNQAMSRGITLVEIFAVIVLVGVIGAVAIAKLGSLSKSKKLDGESRLLFESIAKARSLALKKDVTYLMKFDVTAGTYSTYEDSNSNGIAEASERIASQALDTKVKFGVTTGGPSTGPGGVGNPSLQVETGWDQALALGHDRAGTINTGSLYLYGVGLSSRGTCIRLPSGGRQIEFWRWDGSRWIQN